MTPSLPAHHAPQEKPAGFSAHDRVLEALETIMQFDRDPALGAQARRRYCDLSEQKDQAA